MPELNRRNFMRLAGAASLTPMIPAMPARVAAASGASSSQMLWASLHARAGSAAKFTDLTRSMGISGEITKGIYSNIARNQVLTAQAVTKLNHHAQVAKARVIPQPTATATPPRSIHVDVDRLLSEAADDETEIHIIEETADNDNLE